MATPNTVSAQAVTETANIGGQAPVTNVPAPEPAQTAQDAFNANQAKFDAANPAGTNVADVVKPVTEAQTLAPSPDAVPPAYREGTAQAAPSQINIPAQTVRPAPITAPAPSGVSQFAGTREQIDANKAAYQARKASPTAPQFETKPVDQGNAVSVSGEQRNSEIVRNLNEGYANAPELFQDRASFEKAYGYASKPENERATLDAYWNSKLPKSSDDLFKTYAATGNSTAFANTTEGLQAKHRLELASPYRNADSNALYSGMVSGAIVPGSKAYQDVVTVNGGETQAMIDARKKYDAKIATDNINRNATLMSDGLKKKVTETVDPLVKASESFVAKNGMDYASEFKKDVVENPEIRALVKETVANKSQIDTLENEKRRKVQEIIDKNPGLSTGMALTLARKEISVIDDQLSALYVKQNAATSNLQYQTDLAEKMFGYKMEQAKEAQAQANQIAAEERQFGRAKELATFQSDLALQQSAKEFEQKMAQNAKLATDPVSATQQLLADYKKIGITAQRSDAEIIQDVQNKVAQGMTVGQAISELNQAFQSKPEYARYKEVQAGQLSDREKMRYQTQIENARIAQQQSYDWKKMLAGAQIDMQKLASQYDFQNAKDQQNAYLDLVKNGVDSDSAMAAIRTYTGDWKGATGAQLLQATDGTVIPSRLSQTTNPNGGKECAEFVNDVIGNRAFGDSFSSKMSQCDVRMGSVGSLKQTNKSIPSNVGVGSVAVWQPGNSPAWQKYGHVGIITADNGDSWTIKSSNLHGQGEISSVTVPKNDIWGYKTNAVKTNSASNFGELTGAMDTIIGSGKFTKDQVRQIKNAVANGDDPAQTIKNQAKSLLSGANQSKLEAAEQSRNAFDSLAQSIKAFYDAGGNTNIVKGKFENVVNNLGEVSDPKLVDLATQIKANLQIYRNAISGTAYSDQEGKDIESIFPGINKSKGLNDAVISARKKVFDDLIDGTYRTVLGSAYDKVKSISKNSASQASQSVANPNDVDAIMNAYYNR